MHTISIITLCRAVGLPPTHKTSSEKNVEKLKRAQEEKMWRDRVHRIATDTHVY